MAERGGKRKGAGRKPGAINKLSQDSIALAKEIGVSPLEVVLKAIKEAVDANDTELSVKYAQIALPYTSPKLSQVESKAKVEVDGQSVIEAFSQAILDAANVDTETV